jgi:hypothetical protein
VLHGVGQAGPAEEGEDVFEEPPAGGIVFVRSAVVNADDNNDPRLDFVVEKGFGARVVLEEGECKLQLFADLVVQGEEMGVWVLGEG